jgi:RNA polymerase sigma factor (sigma-70 family)
VTGSSPDKTALEAHALASVSDSQPLSELYGRYRAELLALVRRTIGQGPPEPEDVVQQAFLNFAAQPVEHLANPRAYLHRTAHNIAINGSKRERVRQKYVESSPDPKEVQEARPDWDPEVVLRDRQHYALVKAAIRALPRRQRLYLLMNRVEGLSYAEIGRRVSLSESVIRKQVALAVSECIAALRAADESRSGR